MISEGLSIQSGRDTIQAGRNVNQISGDYVAGDKIVQAIVRPLPVQYRTLVQPLIEHYTAIFGGREAELAALDGFLADPGHPFALLVAPTGRGKTALLVHWIARVQRQYPRGGSSSRRSASASKPPASRSRWDCWPTASPKPTTISTSTAVTTNRPIVCAR